MKIVLDDSDRIDKDEQPIRIDRFKIDMQTVFKASYVVYHGSNKAFIFKNRLDGFVGECSLEKSYEYLDCNLTILIME